MNCSDLAVFVIFSKLMMLSKDKYLYVHLNCWSCFYQFSFCV